jgi:hypothetical protein
MTKNTASGLSIPDQKLLGLWHIALRLQAQRLMDFRLMALRLPDLRLLDLRLPSSWP